MQVYRVPGGGGDPAKSASAYEQLMNGMQPSVVGRCAETGLASLDLVLLGSGADGHTASLYPGSKQVIS
jgi:6-phosphogluconolactonase/glucosamine-6-phosphate isomerase/deaminase